MHSLLSLFLQKCRSDSIPNKGARGMVLVFLVMMVCALEDTQCIISACYFLSGATLFHASCIVGIICERVVTF